MAESTVNTGEQAPGSGEPAQERTFTQEQVDRIVQERLARAKAQVPPDYEEAKAKAAKYDEAQEAAYLNFVEELWEQTFEHYSHNMDSLRAPLRARLLELTDARIELSAAVLARRNATLPPNLREQMVKLHRDVLDTLFVLDRDAVIEEEDIENLELRVGDIEDDFELVSDQITRWLEEQISGSR